MSDSTPADQTPASVHSTSRRQHVLPDPKPSSVGSAFQGMLVTSTKKMPCSAARSDKRLRPGYLNRRSRAGSSGFTTLPRHRHAPS